MRSFYPDIAGNEDYTAIVSERHQKRLLDMIVEAEDRGVNVVRIGDARAANSRKVAPAILVDPPMDILAMQEESGATTVALGLVYLY